MTLQERERVIVPFKLDDVMHLATDFGYFGVVVWRHNNDLFFTADKWQHDFTSVGNLRAHGEKVLDGLEFQYKLAKKQEQEYSSKSIEEQDRLRDVLLDSIEPSEFILGDFILESLPEEVRPFAVFIRQQTLHGLYFNWHVEDIPTPPAV